MVRAIRSTRPYDRADRSRRSTAASSTRSLSASRAQYGATRAGSSRRCREYLSRRSVRAVGRVRQRPGAAPPRTNPRSVRPAAPPARAPALRCGGRCGPTGVRRSVGGSVVPPPRNRDTRVADRRRSRKDIPALPFCHLRLTAKKPDHRHPKILKTLGDHLRKRRFDLGLLQGEVADRLGADNSTINAWELNYHEPSLHRFPAIKDFLGYDPDELPEDAPLGLRIAARRRAIGLSQKALADCLGIDEGTVGRWERGDLQRVSRRVKRLLTRWLSRQK
jgi:transcriptional regulator with XRE-family HTH domain